MKRIVFLLFVFLLFVFFPAVLFGQFKKSDSENSPTFTSLTVTGATELQGAVTISGVVTISTTITSSSSITLTRATLDTFRIMGAGGSFLEIEDNNVSLLDVEADGDFNFDVNTLFVDVDKDAVGINTTAPLKRLDAAGSVRIKGTGTVTLTGTIDPAASVTVDGVGTLFLTELVIGDQLVVTGENRTVTAIASNIECTVDAAFSDNANDTTPDKIESHLVITNSGGTTDVVVDADGNVGIRTASPEARLTLVDDGGTGSYVYTVHADDNVPGLAGYFNDNVSNSTPVMWYFGKDDGEFYFIGKNEEKIHFSVGSFADITMSITDDNVGIGTTAPRGLLDLDAAALADTMFIVDNDVDATLDSTWLVMPDGSINKPAGSLQFDIASGGYLFGEGGTDGIVIDPGNNRISGANATDYIEFDTAVWQTASNNIKIDADAGSVGILTLGDTGDNDTTRVIGYADAQTLVSDTYNFGADSQGDDDYEVAIPGITALTTGLMVTFTANTLNTDGATLEITSVGDLDAILKMRDQALVTGDIEAGQVIVVVFDGTNWQMTSQLAQ